MEDSNIIKLYFTRSEMAIIEAKRNIFVRRYWLLNSKI